MPYVVAAVILVGAVSTLNLILITAVIRRMRVYEEQMYSLAGQPGAIPYHLLGGLLPGAALPSFSGRTADGREVTDEDLRGRPAVVAFLSTDCSSCQEQAVKLATVARDLLDRGGAAVAVVIEGKEPAQALTAAVPPAAVVYEPADKSGPLTRAFEVDSFPTILVVDAEGTVAGRELRDVAAMLEAAPMPAGTA